MQKIQDHELTVHKTLHEDDELSVNDGVNTSADGASSDKDGEEGEADDVVNKSLGEEFEKKHLIKRATLNKDLQVSRLMELK